MGVLNWGGLNSTVGDFRFRIADCRFEAGRTPILIFDKLVVREEKIP